MKPIRFAVFALCAAAVCSTPKVQAETVAPQLQDVVPQMQSATIETIELRNIKPSVMAYWLDPQRETLPDAKRIPLQVDASLVVLPLGIESITAFDKTNQLSIRGSQEGIERVLELVTFLDKPIPMIEVQVQYIHLSKSARPSGDSFNPFSVTFSLPSQYEELKKLIASGKAQIISAPRVTTWNKMQAKVVEERQHFYQEERDKDGRLTGYLPLKWQRKFETVPTLNQDGTLTVDLNLFEGFVFQRSAKPVSAGYVPYAMVGTPKSKLVADEEPNLLPELVKSLPAGSVVLKDFGAHQMNVTTSLKDGDTVLIDGLGSKEPNAGSTEKTVDMLLVTARLVHNAAG